MRPAVVVLSAIGAIEVATVRHVKTALQRSAIEGTLAGLIAGLLVAIVGTRDPRMIVLITVAAFLGSYVESLAGNWNRRQARSVPNGALNFFNTAAGAVFLLLLVQVA